MVQCPAQRARRCSPPSSTLVLSAACHNPLTRTPPPRLSLSPRPAAPAAADTQLRALDTVTSRVLKSVTSLEAARRERLADTVIDLLLCGCPCAAPPPEQGEEGASSDSGAELARSLSGLLGALLNHHLSVSDLRRLLLLLRQAPRVGGSRHAHLGLLEALEWAAVPQHGPSTGPCSQWCFNFGGPQARIDLGCVDPFPEDAVTLWMWLRVEPSQQGVPSSMGLLSMTNDTATGLDLSLEASGRQLALRTYSRGAVDTGAVGVTLVPGKWHSLAVVFEKRTLLSDRAAVYIDGAAAPVLATPTPGGKPAAAAAPGEEEGSGGGGGSGPTVLALKYPSSKGLAGGLTHCSIGSASPGRASLQGQLGCFAAFACAASTKEIEQLHSATRGPHAALEPALLSVMGASFGSAALQPLLSGPSGPPPGAVPQQQSLLPPRLLSGRRSGLVLCLDPRSADSPDATVVYHVGGADGALQPAQLGPHTSCVCTTSFAEALAALGGPTWLLPLLATPELAADAAAALMRDEQPSAGASQAPTLVGLALPSGGAGLSVLEFATAVSLLAASLEDDANRDAFGASNGLLTLSVLLQTCPAQHLSPPLLAAVRRLVASLAPRPDMHAEAACRLLLDLSLWGRQGGAVSLAHLAALTEWLPRSGMLAGTVGPHLTGRHVIRAIAGTPRSQVQYSASAVQLTYRDALLGLLQQLLACDPSATHDILAAMTWDEHGAHSGGGGHTTEAAMPDECLEDILDALLAVAERQLGAPGGACPPGPCAGALVMGGCGMAAAIALLKSGTTSSGLRAGALRLAQLSLVATSTAAGDAAGNAASGAGAPSAEAAGAAAAATQGVPSDAPSGSSAAPSSSLLPSSGAATPSLLPLEPLCAGPRPDQAAALCSALVEGCAASSEGGVTLALWDALCPVLLEGVAGAPVRPPPGPGDTPSRRQSSNLAAQISTSASTSAGASPRSSLDMADDPRAASLLLSARLGAAAVASGAASGPSGNLRQSVNMLAGPDAFAGGVVPPRGGGCRNPPMGSPPPRRLPGGHTARLAPSAATALVPALVALRHAATPEVRLAAARDCAAVLLTSSTPAAAASRSVLYAQPGWVEAFLSLALWAPQQPRAAWPQQSVPMPATQPPVAATAASPPEPEDAAAAAAPAADETAEEQPAAGTATGEDAVAPSQPATPPLPPLPTAPATRQPLELPLAQGPLGAAALALWKDRVIPTPAVMPSPNAPFTEDLAIAFLRATGPDPLLSALRAPFATPLRRAALIAALSGAFASDGDVLTCVAHDVLVECVAATTASAMCRDAGLPNPSVPGTWAHPLERLRAAIEAAGECARASRTARRDVSRLVLLRTAAHARALLDGGWVSAAQAADGDDAAADPNRDYAPPLPDDAAPATSASRAPGTALSAAQEGNVRANLLVLGSLCVDELEAVDGILCPPPVDLTTDAPSSVALEASLAIATRWIWRASAPPLPRGAGGAAAPPWLDDERSPQCGGAGCHVICAPGRRHHCRMCGGVFCADCSPSKALLPEPPLLQRGNGPHRVCVPCMDAAAPLQGILKTGALMPGALRAAPAYGALRSLVADLADRCACTPGAPPAGPAVAAVSQWLVRAGIVRPDSAADAVPAAVDATAAAAAAAVSAAVSADAAPPSAAPAAAATASDVLTPFLPAGDETTVVMVPQPPVAQQAPPAAAAGPFILEAEPGDARVSRQQLLRWTLLRLFAVLSETLAARDAAATSGGDAAQAARLNNAAMQVCALAARVARATDPLDEGVDDEAYVGDASAGDSSAGDTSADASGIPLRLAFQRAFAALSRGDGDMLSSAAALAASDTARLLGGPAFGPVRSNAWATAARVARVMRFGRARRLVLEAGTQMELLDALRSRSAADACVAADAAVATLCRVAAGAAYEEAAMLIGGNTPQAQLTAWRVPGPFAPQRTSLAAAAHTACAARALRRLAFSAGPWALTRAEMREGRAFWRLDWTEDPHRIRRRLKRYAHGSSHVGAAHATTAALMADAADAAALSSGEGLLVEDSQPLTDDPTSPAAVGGPHHRRQHSLHLVRAVSLTSRRLSVEDMVAEDEDDPFAVDDEPGDDQDGDGDQSLMMAAVEEEDGDGNDEYDDDGDGEDEEGGDDDLDAGEEPQQHLSFLSPRMSGGSGGGSQRTPRMGPPSGSPGSEGAPSTGDSSISGSMQRTPSGVDSEPGVVMDDAPPVVITIGGISLTPRPYPTPGPTGKAFSRISGGGDGSQTLDAVDEAADAGIEEEDTEAGSGSEDVSDAALGMHPRRSGHGHHHRAGTASEPQSAASSAASSGGHVKSRRGLLRRFRAGAKSVADATARVRLATGEAITAIRDDVTAAADAAARVASNTLAMGGLQGLMRSNSMKISSSGGSGSGGMMLAGAAGMAGSSGGGGSLGGGQPSGGVLQPSFVAPAELIRPTRVAPGTVYVTRVAVEWIPAPAVATPRPQPPQAPLQTADTAAPQPGEPQAPSAVDGAMPAATPPADTPVVDPGVAAPERSRRWPLSDLVAIYPRRFLLRRRALELFLASGKSVLLHLPEALAGEGSTAPAETSAADELHRAILNERPPRLVTSPLFAQPLTARRLLRRSRWMTRWASGEMSNLEYLMLLNTAAGRTFNDLQQYPVFPWILADYESPELDLDSPATFRDLSKPVGALNPVRLRAYVDRYEAMAKGDGAMSHGVPPFHYGTHYSSLGSVLFFLLRLAPFTEAALALQEGRLDVADRLFADIGESWRNANTASADVKELIPELFTCPELLRNAAGLPLGNRQDGKSVSDVTLPPWAHGSPERFVRMHRDALESEYVSQRLHHWIDLIFGYKQRGPAAETAHNLFYFLTYEGAVDVDAITDPMERAAVEAQIALFGQCPGQLFTVPHPQRQPGASRKGTAATRVPLQMHVRPGARPGPVLRLLPHDPTSAPPAALYFHPGEHHGCTLVDADGCIHPLRFGGVVSVSAASGDDGTAGGVPGGAGEPGDAASEAQSGSGAASGAGGVETLSIVLEEKVKRSLLPVGGAPNASSNLQPWKGPHGGTTTISAACSQAVPPYMRAALVPGTGGGVLVAGHWAGLVWLMHPDDPLCGPIQAIQHPASGASMCVAASEDGNVAATGGGDGSLALWRVGLPSSSSQGGAAPGAGVTIDCHRGALAGSTAESLRNSSSRRLGRRDKSQCLLDVFSNAGQPAVRCWGHQAALTAVAVSAQLGVCLSGSADGTCLLHALRDGRCIRALRVPPSAHDVDTADALVGTQAQTQEEDLCGAVIAVAIGPEGELVIHAAPSPAAGMAGRHLLCVYSLNGRPMGALQLRTPLLAMSVSACGRWLVTASDSAVTVLALHTLEPVAEVTPPRDAGAVTCAALSPCGRALLWGTAEGGVCGSVMDAVLCD